MEVAIGKVATGKAKPQALATGGSCHGEGVLELCHGKAPLISMDRQSRDQNSCQARRGCRGVRTAPPHPEPTVPQNPTVDKRRSWSSAGGGCRGSIW